MTDLSVQYQMKSARQHILDKPDTYIGSIQNTDTNMWCFDQESGKIILRNIEYVPGLYKIFDEGIVNCRDHVIRTLSKEELSNVTYIETTIDDDGTITFCNDGSGVDVIKHPEHDLWIPEMIFAHLRTSTNYDVNTVRRVGGSNGYGQNVHLRT